MCTTHISIHFKHARISQYIYHTISITWALFRWYNQNQASNFNFRASHFLVSSLEPATEAPTTPRNSSSAFFFVQKHHGLSTIKQYETPLIWVCLKIVYPYTQWFCWSLSLLNGYFIGGIPHFQTYHICSLNDSERLHSWTITMLNLDEGLDIYNSLWTDHFHGYIRLPKGMYNITTLLR